jgi:hypothetical protein
LEDPARRSLPENLLHGRPVGREVFLQPSTANRANSFKAAQNSGVYDLLGREIQFFSVPGLDIF